MATTTIGAGSRARRPTTSERGARPADSRTRSHRCVSCRRAVAAATVAAAIDCGVDRPADVLLSRHRVYAGAVVRRCQRADTRAIEELPEKPLRMRIRRDQLRPAALTEPILEVSIASPLRTDGRGLGRHRRPEQLVAGRSGREASEGEHIALARFGRFLWRSGGRSTCSCACESGCLSLARGKHPARGLSRFWA